ncbi:hypothetical protein [Enterococcus mundtii]|uniref:Transcriptional regulator n=1 Tax=Enterococcus mundtii TaxID=53346 RepID=A0A1L8V2K7_ENTMU|nr:hypothetical protein [Enterococcus mundtii]GEN17390.1 transcriptional regulator [Ligilactobacillus acidipiscis]AUB52809.1 hypothetical protein EM4838_07335 [Enterococcus mundtii]MDB7088369.1 hypothetical protein [Enterococcus mundtii]MZZ58588.1 hypothetical protein [Enterococcus mundtii]MZZ61381.1 hypothetical protein [Enterococcus mundtii]
MNFLVVLKDTILKRSTFIYTQIDEQKTVLHFSPEFHLEGLTIGEIYEQGGIQAAKQFFVQELQLPLNDYLEVSLNEWDKAISELFPQGINVESGTTEVHLSVKDLQRQMRYQIDEEGSLSIFQRQQKILKSFLKQISRKRNLFKTTQLLKKYPELLHTSIQFPQLLSLIRRFVRLKEIQSKKLTLPLQDTFRVVKREDEKKLIVIDFMRNRHVLQQMTMEKAN